MFLWVKDQSQHVCEHLMIILQWDGPESIFFFFAAQGHRAASQAGMSGSMPLAVAGREGQRLRPGKKFLASSYQLLHYLICLWGKVKHKKKYEKILTKLFNSNLQPSRLLGIRVKLAAVKIELQEKWEPPGFIAEVSEPGLDTARSTSLICSTDLIKMNPLTYVKVRYLLFICSQKRIHICDPGSFHRYVITRFPNLCHSAGNADISMVYGISVPGITARVCILPTECSTEKSRGIVTTLQEEKQKQILICVSNEHISRNTRLSYRP